VTRFVHVHANPVTNLVTIPNLVSCLRFDETRFDHCDEIYDGICDELLTFDFDLGFDFLNLVNQISSSGNNWV